MKWDTVLSAIGNPALSFDVYVVEKRLIRSTPVFHFYLIAKICDTTRKILIECASPFC